METTSLTDYLNELTTQMPIDNELINNTCYIVQGIMIFFLVAFIAYGLYRFFNLFF